MRRLPPTVRSTRTRPTRRRRSRRRDGDRRLRPATRPDGRAPYAHLGVLLAVQWASSTYWSPAESVTLPAVAPQPLQTPTRTTMRLPTVRVDVGVTDRLVPTPCAVACCTNVGDPLADDGVTAFDAAEGGPAPAGLLAVTVNVYAFPGQSADRGPGWRRGTVDSRRRQRRGADIRRDRVLSGRSSGRGSTPGHKNRAVAGGGMHPCDLAGRRRRREHDIDPVVVTLIGSGRESARRPYVNTPFAVVVERRCGEVRCSDLRRPAAWAPGWKK